MSRKRGFEICKGYENEKLNLPIRKTKHAVGYDVESAEDIIIPSIWKSVFKNFSNFLKGAKEESEIKPTLIKTGIKAYFGEDEAMFIANRSSGPKKMGLVMANGLGIFECDYYSNPSNDGNILFQYYNFFPIDVKIKKYDTIGQAWFQNFLVVDNDTATGERIGGFGSTDKK